MTLQRLQGEILSLRGGLQILRDLQPLLAKAEPADIIAMHRLFMAVYEEGNDEGRIAAKYRTRRGL